MLQTLLQSPTPWIVLGATLSGLYLLGIFLDDRARQRRRARRPSERRAAHQRTSS